MPKVKVSITIESRTEKSAKSLAKKQKRSFSSLVDIAIEKYIEENKEGK